MEETPEKKPASPAMRLLKLIAKIAVTALCFWYISRKIDLPQVGRALTSAHPGYLLAAWIFFLLSKWASAIRLNIYFRNISLSLPAGANLRLYWLGMFYNLFLPGAISGDAYKVILLTKRYGIPYKKTAAAVLLDRFSGLLALGIILAAYGGIVLNNYPYEGLLVACAALATAGLYYGIYFYFRDFLPGFWPTFYWGLAVQLLQVACVYGIVLALGLPAGQHAWIFIFLAAAVISVLPVSLGGGLGTRELVFVEGARFFHLDQQMALVVSLLFYLITVLGSAPGLYYVFRDPLPAAD
ncbi:MAG TPA: lysylphosphatidylglycerol synthase transmembrane domain-containing protein [Chitinophagaceae bacterium]|nr:lysylphosphatidylglycerol synthase transmembrane domain-containing protein [Chitinophagaceae bacterium]